MESYKHLYAKKVLAEWYGRRAYLEWPVCEGTFLTGSGEGGFKGWFGSTRGIYESNWSHVTEAELGDHPSYEDIVSHRCSKFIERLRIFDLAVFTRDGVLNAAVEIVHKHDVSEQKLRDFLDLQTFCGKHYARRPSLYRCEADWILSQTKSPGRFEMERLA